MESSSSAIASAASLRSQTPTFQVKVWRFQPDLGFSKVIYKFWIEIPTNGQRKPDFSVASRKNFSSPCCDRPTNLPREFLVKLVSGYDEAPVHHSFSCHRCGSTIDCTAEW